MLLENEIALVTGASRGIGKAIALALAKEGAHVFVNYTSRSQSAEEVCHEIQKCGGSASPIQFDVSNVKDTQEKVESILKEKKRISILVNNAGITKDNLLLRYSVDDWDKVLDTNLRSAFIISQMVIRPMMKERKGSIIHMSSIVGLIGNPGQSAYCAAKAGLIGLTKSMAKELASRNIRVNAIAPGFITTEMTSDLIAEQKDEILKNVPLKRMGTPDEVAHAVLFLSSERSQYITGQVIQIDGGLGM